MTNLYSPRKTLNTRLLLQTYVSVKATMTSTPQVDLFNWLKKRSAGILLHPTSLPNTLGIGTFGYSARGFIDFLEAAGFEYWQVCPLGPTGFGDSPYQSFSSFAGNPYLIDLQILVNSGLLTQSDLAPLKQLPEKNVDYGSLYKLHPPILEKTFTNFKKSHNPQLFDSFEKFKKAKASWLDPYTAFMAFKHHFDGKSWLEWEPNYRSYANAIQTPLLKELAPKRELYSFIQYLFFKQWSALHEYADAKNIQIIGDLPIFVALDSADVWSNPTLFELDSSGKPTQLAGVPPDYFSEKGQFWGNPLYNWKIMKEQNYDWWINRLSANYLLYDVIRLDHFRGFESYWSIPAGSPDARSGKWIQGPGLEFFQTIHKHFPAAKIIAEDLGMITEKVRELLASTGLPGMAVFQFAFDLNSKNLFLPHHLQRNQILYTGTHDNTTTRAWYESQLPQTQDQIRKYLRVPGNDVAWDLIHKAYESVCHLIILPVQDLLNKGAEARMNFPGQSQGNWQWRMTHSELHHLVQNVAGYLRSLKSLYDR